jgi:TolA-binding protein
MESEATQQQPQQSPQPQQGPTDGSVAVLAWLEVNKQRLMMGGVIALVAILGGSLFLQQRGQRERAASRAFSDVKLPFNPAAPAAPGTAEALLKVATEYSGTKAAERALLTGAGILYSEKKYAEAEARFAQVTKEYPETQWAPQAHLGIAASLEAQGKKNEAVAKFEEVRRRFPSSAVSDEAKLSLARLYETTKPEDAYKLYDELAKGQPGSRTAMEAAMRQEDLLKARPELVKLKESLTPPPVAPTPVPAQPTGTSAPVQIKLNPTPGK